MLCSNCHGEVHNGLTELPETYARFNEELADYKELERKERLQVKLNKKVPCKFCKKLIGEDYIYCSKSCQLKNQEKVLWDSVDLEKLLKEQTQAEVARFLGVTDTAIWKRCKRLGISYADIRTVNKGKR